MWTTWSLSRDWERFLCFGASTRVLEVLLGLAVKGSGCGSKVVCSLDMEESLEWNGPLDFFQLLGMNEMAFMVGGQEEVRGRASKGDKSRDLTEAGKGTTLTNYTRVGVGKLRVK